MKKALLAAGCVLAATAPSTAKHLSEFGIAGDATEIRRTVSGKTCHGLEGSILSFGTSTPGSPGTFTRVGQTSGTYQIGYGTLLVDRDGQLHSHVVSVSLQGREFYLGGERYRCELVELGPAAR